MRRLSMADFLFPVNGNWGQRERKFSFTFFFDDGLDDVVDVMMDVFVHDRPLIHDNTLERVASTHETGVVNLWRRVFGA